MKIKNLHIAVTLGIATFCGFDTEAALQQQKIPDALAISSTNTYALNGDATGTYTNGAIITSPNTFIDGSKSTMMPVTVGGLFANTGTAGTIASNVVVTVYSSQNNSLWTSYTNVTLAVPGATTNYVYTTFIISGSSGGVNSCYGIRSIANTNSTVTAPTNGVFLSASPKQGV